MMNRLLFLLILLTFTAPHLTASPFQSDSLWMIYRDGQQTDSARFAALMNLGNKVYRNQKGDLDSAELCFRMGIRFAGDRSSQKFLASAYNNMGSIKQFKNQLDSAIFYREKSVMLYKELEEYGLAAGVLSNLSATYGAQSNHVKTLQCLNESLSLLNKTDNTRAKLAVLFNLALVYSDLSYLDQSEKCYLDILEIYDAVPKDPYYSMASLNLSSIYVNNKNYEKAEHYLTLALESARNIEDVSSEQLVLINLADVYLAMENYERAETYYQKAIAIEGALYEDLAYCKYYYEQSIVYTSRKEWSKALSMAEKSYSFAKEMIELKLRYKILYQIYELNKKLGNTQKALTAYEEYIVLLDSNTSIENKEAAIQFKYKIAYKEKQIMDSLDYVKQQEIVELEHQAKWQEEMYLKYLLIATLIILALGSSLLVQRYLHKRKELDYTSQKLRHSTKDLNRAATLTKTKKEAEDDLVNEIQKTLPELDSDAQARLKQLLKNQKWKELDWVEEDDFLENIVAGSSEFESALLNRFPELSKSDVELCTYLKTGYSTKKISQLRNVSTDAVKKAKQRLRKKLEIDSRTDLYIFLQQIDN